MGTSGRGKRQVQNYIICKNPFCLSQHACSIDCPVFQSAPSLYTIFFFKKKENHSLNIKVLMNINIPRSYFLSFSHFSFLFLAPPLCAFPILSAVSLCFFKMVLKRASPPGSLLCSSRTELPQGSLPCSPTLCPAHAGPSAG